MKKALLVSLAFMLVAAMAVGITVAYLQDEDSAVNVMTLGNVYIEQIEQERDANGNLVPFTQAKPAYPAVGPIGWAPSGVEVNGTEYKVFTADLKNVVDKIVTVNNTGKSDAYVRTVVAIEAPDYDPNDLIHINWNGTDTTISAPVVTKIDGVDYVVFTFTYKEAVKSGEKSAPSLMQVFLDAAAKNEDVAKFGDSWDIRVISQAIQTAGFADAKTALDTGFGEANATNVAAWFGTLKVPAVASNADELVAALAAGGEVILSKDIALEDEKLTVAAGAEAVLNLNGKTLSVKNTEQKASSAIDNKGELTVKNGTVTYEGVGDPAFGYGTNTITNSGKLIIDGASVINTTNSGSSNAIDNAPGAELIMNSGELKSEKIALRLRDNSNVTINGGSITGSRAIQIHLFQKVDKETVLTINDGTFTSTDSTYNLALYSIANSGSTFKKTTVNINGGTFNGNVIFGGGDKTATENVNITGGTFNGELGRYLANDGWADITLAKTAADLTLENLISGGEVFLMNDVTLTENTAFAIKDGKTATLKLNGNTLSGTNTNTATHNFLFDANNGTLNVSNGTVEYTHTGTNMGWNGATTVFDVTGGGVLNMDGVTVKVSGTDMNFAVHLNNWGEVTLNANNCVFDATYCGVRVFNSGYDMNNVKITNSTLKGNTRAFWVHNYIGDLNSAQHSDDAIKARLNLDIYGNGNEFVLAGTAKSPIRYGFGTTVYYDVNGNLVP